MNDQLERQTYTIEEAAKLLGIGRNQAYEAAKRGEIPTIRLGKRLVVPRAALERMLENGNGRGSAEIAATPPSYKISNGSNG